MIRRDEITGPIEWTVENLVENYGVRPSEAEFIVAVNTGKIKGDIVKEGTTSGTGFKQEERDITLRAASSRLPMWINRYTEVMNTAKVMAGGDKKLKWVLGPTEHCSSCLKLAGKVKRASQWLASGIQPQSRQLACQGFNCLCALNPTSDALSRGRLPSLP